MYKLSWKNKECEKGNLTLLGRVEDLVNDGREIRHVKDGLVSAFNWRNSPEGNDFWQMANILFDIKEKYFTPEDIEVGARYTNGSHQATYLGVELRDGTKTMVVLTSNDGKDGREVVNPEYDYFWSEFKKID